jgi:hypothetical protein
MARNNTEGISQVVNPLILVTLRSRASQILVVFDPPLAVAVSFPSCIHIGQNWMQLIMNAGKADWPFECATTNKNDMRVSLIAVTKIYWSLFLNRDLTRSFKIELQVQFGKIDSKWLTRNDRESCAVF